MPTAGPAAVSAVVRWAGSSSEPEPLIDEGVRDGLRPSRPKFGSAAGGASFGTESDSRGRFGAGAWASAVASGVAKFGASDGPGGKAAGMTGGRSPADATLAAAGVESVSGVVRRTGSAADADSEGAATRRGPGRVSARASAVVSVGTASGAARRSTGSMFPETSDGGVDCVPGKRRSTAVASALGCGGAVVSRRGWSSGISSRGVSCRSRRGSFAVAGRSHGEASEGGAATGESASEEATSRITTGSGSGGTALLVQSRTRGETAIKPQKSEA